jgi:hypothetical protein
MVRLLSEQPSSVRRPGRVSGVVAQYAQPIAGLVGFKER